MIWIIFFSISIVILIIITGFILRYVFVLLLKSNRNLPFGYSPVYIELKPEIKEYTGSLSYIWEGDFRHQMFNQGSLVLQDEKHKQYVMKTIVSQCTNTMLQDNMIDIMERQNPCNPYEKIVNFRIRIVKPYEKENNPFLQGLV